MPTNFFPSYRTAGNYVSIIFRKLPNKHARKKFSDFLAITKCSHFWSIMSKVVYHTPLHRQMSSVPWLMTLRQPLASAIVITSNISRLKWSVLRSRELKPMPCSKSTRRRYCTVQLQLALKRWLKNLSNWEQVNLTIETITYSLCGLFSLQ